MYSTLTARLWERRTSGTGRGRKSRPQSPAGSLDRHRVYRGIVYMSRGVYAGVVYIWVCACIGVCKYKACRHV